LNDDVVEERRTQLSNSRSIEPSAGGLDGRHIATDDSRETPWCSSVGVPAPSVRTLRIQHVAPQVTVQPIVEDVRQLQSQLR
jgi:hypothetical protein